MTKFDKFAEYETINPKSVKPPVTMIPLNLGPPERSENELFVVAYPPHECGEVLQASFAVVAHCLTLDEVMSVALLMAETNSGIIAVVRDDGEGPIFAMRKRTPKVLDSSMN